jgi:trk system potassium uptake protein
MIFKKKTLNELQILILGFFVIIFIGAILLSLPISSNRHTYTNFLDSIFVSTSATCVTGLVTVDTGTHWSYFGKSVILALIQIGGLGFMSFSTLIALALGRKITLRERMIIHQSINSFNLGGLVKMSKYILIFTFSIEAVGAAILSIQFIPQFGVYKGIFYSVFHSVSAFCNAGIDIIGSGSSLTTYYDNSTVILVIGFLVIIGGLGFYVWKELYSLRSFRQIKLISVNSKVCISVTSFLLIFGTILFFIFEFNNPETMGNMSLKNKLLSSFFASLSPRTAGFNSISIENMSGNSKFLTMIMMFIGGSPGSTAGGLKTTTFALIVMTAVSVIRGREETEIYKRTIRRDLVYKAIVILIIDLLILLISCMILGLTEHGKSMESIIFECVSAFGTAGLSLGITSSLSIIGKIVIIILMFFGRLGGLTIILAMTHRKVPRSIKYPEGKILIG